jgi:hypothetical protein
VFKNPINFCLSGNVFIFLPIIKIALLNTVM